MCHVTKYSTIRGVFQQPWPGVSPTAIFNEEKALGTRLAPSLTGSPCRRLLLSSICTCDHLFTPSFFHRHLVLVHSFIRSLPGVGGTPLYNLYRYVQRQRVWFFSLFGLKQGINWDHIGLK